MTPPELFLELRGGQTAFAPGETLEASALWALSAAPRSLEARLCWFTRGKGTEDATVVATEPVEAPGPAGERVFRFTLPDAPYSFSGKLISVIWAVELVAEPGSKYARCEFVMAPHRAEIVLEAAPPRARSR